MSRFVMPYAQIQFFDDNGKPLAYGKLYTYVAGTTTPKGTYTSSTGAANTNPIILDSSGRANVWLDTDTSYKLILKDTNDVQLWSVDNLTDFGGSFADGVTALAGDVSGGYSANTVDKIKGTAVSTTTPTSGQALVYTGGKWTPGGVDLTAGVSGVLPTANGGTGMAYFTVSGPATSAKTFTFPNANDTVATYAVANVFTKGQTVTPSTITQNSGDGTIATDASLSNWFRVTLDYNGQLSTPTNPTNGQIVTWEVIQGAAGSKTMSFSSAFAFGTTVTTPTITITENKRDFITAVYNSTTTKWYVLYVTQGY